MRYVWLMLLWSSMIEAAVKPATFLGRRDYMTQGGPIAVADFNGDHAVDVVESIGTTLNTFLGNGSGTFRSPISSSLGLETVIGMVAIDLNGDGNADLIVSGNQRGATSPAGIGVCYSNGDGTFQSAILYQAGGDSSIGTMVVGDFNGDGIPDAVTVGDSGIWLFLGRGGGVFGTAVLIPTAGLAYANVAAADFNGDNKLDLAVTFAVGPPSRSRGFILLPGNGDGTFQAPVTYPIPTSAPGNDPTIVAGDLNNDGRPDIVIDPNTKMTPNVLVYLNNGKGGFANPAQVDLPGSWGMAIGDVNGDGIPDLADSDGYIAFGQGNGKFRSPPVHYAVEANGNYNVYNMFLVDLRGKGLLDIVAGEFFGFSVLLNEGKGKYQDGAWVSVPGAGSCGAAADFNGDGKPDLAVPTGNGIVIMLGTGKASAPYATGATIPLSGPGCPISGDLNGDGIPDLLVGANSLGGVGAYLGNGDGTFMLAGVVAMGPGIIVLGDFNHDGKPDLASQTNS